MSDVWPIGTTRNTCGALTIGGVSLIDIAEDYGTPTYIYDESTLRHSMSSIRDAFASVLPSSRVVYAGKAFLASALVSMLIEEGLGLDTVSGGELYVGLKAGMPPERLSLHGNNKSVDELRMAIDAGIGKIIVDNFDEIEMLRDLCGDLERPVTVLLRLNPGVDVHTHRKISTGVVDSKFGLPIAGGQAERAVQMLATTDGVHLAGYHAHIGSQLFDTDGFTDAIDEMLAFAARMKDEHGVEMEQLSPGGGLGIAYVDTDDPLAVAEWAKAIADAITAGCERHGLPVPIVTVEPGRSISGRAGVALYEVGTRKEIPGVRTYVSVDGGMADNIRPALYEAVYTASLANRDGAGETERVTIAGKYCESGDILIEDISLPTLKRGDLLAVPAAGAYCMAMASNYNMALRPAIVMVGEGNVNVIRRRETLEDLVRMDQ
jgi:diaminopimelate decarboxylase